jgi:hypothetical protein
MDLQFTRPVRAAAQLLRRPDDLVDQLLKSARVLIRIDETFCRSQDARETLLLAVNQCLRFCPNIAVCVPLDGVELVEQCNHIASAVHGVSHKVSIANIEDFPSFTAIINIGTEILRELPCTTVNSSGWVARVSPAQSDGTLLTWNAAPPNAIGAHAAACLGVSQAFLHLINEPRVPAPFEISLLNYETAAPGSLDSGPLLPLEPVDIDAWLIGCGAVSNGWTYTVKRLPIKGRVGTVDRESLGIENFGSYVAADRKHLNKPKVDLIRDLLNPSIMVTPYADEWELFKIRLEFGLSVPSLIVGGLDNVETRHSVQRLWPEHLIDMAAGGFTSQVLIKSAGAHGLCLLGALRRPPNEPTHFERLSQQTGLQIERILKAPTEIITKEDVASAPQAIRHELEVARQQGELICGRIRRHNLSSDANGSDFAPAVPFVTSFSGVVGAAETMKWLMGQANSESLHFQYSFQSGRGRALQMECSRDCECASRAMGA